MVFTGLFLQICLIDCGRSISPLFSCLVIFPIGLIILLAGCFIFGLFLGCLFVCLVG